MKLDQAINQFVASTIAALQMAGSVAGARVHVDGGQAQAYAAGWDDALVALARTLGVVDVDELPAPKPAPALLGRPLTPRAPLTSREKEVARMIYDGCTSEEIAERMGIEYAGVRKHRQHIKAKLGVSDREGLELHLAMFAVPASAAPLTFREIEVGRLLMQGMAREEVAGALGITLDTVKAHADNIFKKLGIHKAVELRAHAEKFAEVPA